MSGALELSQTEQYLVTEHGLERPAAEARTKLET
jgi:hypothetical protein